MRKKWNYVLFFVVMLPLFILSCSKKGFIDEDQLGNGIHYYPLILNNRLYDTVSKKYLTLKDNIFSSGQTLVFEIDYYSRDPISHIELWSGKSGKSLQKIESIPYKPSFYSYTKGLDTTLFSYTLPALDSTLTQWLIEPRVITKHTLQGSFKATISIR